MQYSLSSIALAALATIGFGCVSTNVNPLVPKAHTGYVDLYTQTADDLSWDVGHAETPVKPFKTVFSDVMPIQGRVLRLAFPPGRHQLRLTFLNRVILKPAEVEIEVEDAKITPTCVTFTEAGDTLVKSRETSAGSTAHGRYGRRTKITKTESAMYNVSAVAGQPIAYQPKERMPYAQ